MKELSPETPTIAALGVRAAQLGRSLRLTYSDGTGARYSLITPRVHFGSAVVGDRVFTAAGWHNDGGFGWYQDVVEAYDPAKMLPKNQNSWA